ncbi:MAG TPA: hypothetical protein VFQ00_07950 [Terriglobales bacterium]|nr:hypothetical protein [Terriglobales bacterium]
MKRNVTIIFCLVSLVFIWRTGWQIAAAELANVELHEDMKDIAAHAGDRIGLVNPRSDEEYRDRVVLKAKGYDIDLDPDHVRVERTGEGVATQIYLAADYDVPIHVSRFSFSLHFSPSTAKTQTE